MYGDTITAPIVRAETCPLGAGRHIFERALFHPALVVFWVGLRVLFKAAYTVVTGDPL